MVLDKQKYNRYHRESLELMTVYLKHNGIDLKKQYPRVQEFCRLQNLKCPQKKECADWLVELYRSGTNKIVCKPGKRRLVQAQKQKSTFYDEDIEFLREFDEKMEKHSDMFVSFEDAYFYLSKCIGYGHREFDDLPRFVKLSDVRQFTNGNPPSHGTYLQSIRWKTIKDYIREKFNYTCQKCGIELADDLYRLHTHHITYERLGNENLDTDLILLCDNCHQKEHSKK